MKKAKKDLFLVKKSKNERFVEELGYIVSRIEAVGHMIASVRQDSAILYELRDRVERMDLTLGEAIVILRRAEAMFAENPDAATVRYDSEDAPATDQ